MKPTSMDERIERLEKQNRRLQKTLILMSLSVVALVIMGAKAGLQDAQFGKITARQITIVDTQGNKVIEIGVDKSAGTGMRIINGEGTQLVGLGIAADEGGSGLLIRDKQGRARFGLGMDRGVPSVALTDENGKKIIGLGGDQNGYGLVIMDGNEVERAGIGHKEGNTGIVIYDKNGQYLRGMVSEADGGHYSSYIDSKGNEVIFDKNK